jgi:hypothetical protein
MQRHATPWQGTTAQNQQRKERDKMLEHKDQGSNQVPDISERFPTKRTIWGARREKQRLQTEKCIIK